MKLEFYIARRYLFAKKSKNIINIISMISMLVVAFVTAAMIIVMSAFSGIETLVQDLFANFDAPLTVLPAEGRSFADSLLTDNQLKQLPGIEAFSRVIEEDGWINCVDHNTVATIKGVDDGYRQLAPLDSMMYIGQFQLNRDSTDFAVVGLGVRGELMMPMSNEQSTILNINAPIRGRKLSRYRENAFNRESIIVSGVFSANAELDMKYVFVPLSFARRLFSMEDQISSIEIKLKEGTDEIASLNALKAMLHSGLRVQTRYEKNALVYKANESEKWFTFLILFFILIIACFNIIASLTMLIIEKKKDIYVLGSMGAHPGLIERIFIYEGVFINLLGAAIGTVLGLGACWAQQKFGFIPMEGAVVDYYPVKVHASDVLFIFSTVVLLGSLFCITLVRQLIKRFV